jgi:hypothetical protein
VKESVLNIYRHLASEAFKAEPPQDPNKNYARYASLRKVVHLVVTSLASIGSEHQMEFENLLLIVHYYSMRASMQTLSGLESQIAKVINLFESSLVLVKIQKLRFFILFFLTTRGKI